MRLSLADAYAPLVVEAQVLPRERVERWVAEQHEARQEGTFFAACNYYAYLARREPADRHCPETAGATPGIEWHHHGLALTPV